MRLDRENIFIPQQGYVALSRVRELSGLLIYSLDFSVFKSDPRILDFLHKLGIIDDSMYQLNRALTSDHYDFDNIRELLECNEITPYEHLIIYRQIYSVETSNLFVLFQDAKSIPDGFDVVKLHEYEKYVFSEHETMLSTKIFTGPEKSSYFQIGRNIWTSYTLEGYAILLTGMFMKNYDYIAI